MLTCGVFPHLLAFEQARQQVEYLIIGYQSMNLDAIPNFCVPAPPYHEKVVSPTGGRVDGEA